MSYSSILQIIKWSEFRLGTNRDKGEPHEGNEIQREYNEGKDGEPGCYFMRIAKNGDVEIVSCSDK